MSELTVRLTSVGPMLMNSDKLADTLSDAAKEVKKMTDDRTFKATDEGKLAIARAQYMAALYLDEKQKPCLPMMNVRKSLIMGARLSKGGKEVERGVIVLDSEISLQYKGPKTKEALWEDKRFVDARTVVIGRAKQVRYRPLFRKWMAEVQLLVSDDIINIQNLMNYWRAAGQMIGIGDFRPLFGRYEVEIID
jgi:hypothetical protein